MKKKGFTLIELLAVIVILAIIALIAVPIVLNLINNSKESAKLRSAELYLDAVNNAIAQYQLKNSEIPDGTYEIMSDGNICLGTITDNVCDNTLTVSVDGEKPVGDSITIENSKITDVTLNYGTDKILMDANGNLAYEVVLAPGLYNSKGTLLASWDELVNDYGMDVQKNYEYNSKDVYRPASIIDDNFEDATILIMDKNINYIGDYAFGACENLIKIEISDSVTYIGIEAFADCEDLTNIKFGTGLKEIMDCAFFGCSSLINVEIPSNVTKIGESAFDSCENLINVEISNGVTSIGDYAFAFCTNLTIIEIPSSVTSIGSGIFSECTGLTTVILNNGVTSIGSAVFENCTSLKTIKIPNSITSIVGDAFYGCTALTSITIPSSVTSIGSNAFSRCTNLETVYFEHTTAPTFGSSSFSKSSGVVTTFYFKNSTVADAFTTSHYNSSYGTKSTNYNW